MDETTAPVLDPRARPDEKTGYLWALARDDRGFWGGAVTAGPWSSLCALTVSGQ